LQNISAQSGVARIHSDFFPFTAASLCNLLEENESSLPLHEGGFDVTFKPYEVITLRLRTAPTAPSPAPMVSQ
ncbi:MAG: glycosyl hydrolase-related protein, partial [Candidatus Acidiferrales bacterium]